MNRKDVISKLEELLFRAKGDFEKTHDLLQTVELSEKDIGGCLEEISKEYNTLLKEVSWVCGITVEGGKMANAKNFNDTFKLGSEN